MPVCMEWNATLTPSAPPCTPQSASHAGLYGVECNPNPFCTPQSASHAGLYGVDLEPDPRYQRCCSNVFRPGRVLRDCCLGLLVLFVIATVIGAMFLLVFFVLKGGYEAEEAVW